MKVKSPGFSIAELLIWIAVVGILMTFMLPKFGQIMQRGKETGTKSLMNTMSSALQQYSLDVGRYPTTRDGGLDVLINRPGGKEGERWRGPYLEGYDEVPADAWGGEFEYNSPPREFTKKYKRFEIISRGSDPDEEKSALHVGS
ncbi:type II secretion system protein GspG [Candidatus Babeliales bacterium]|nr:type II secretion system protein GspG [Candidatus Babeliales bacterium]